MSDTDRAGAIRPGEGSGSAGLTRLTGWFAAVAIAASTLVMIVVSAAGPNVSVPVMPRPGGGPPW